MGKFILYIDMDGVLCDFVKARDEALLKNPYIHYPQSQYGFFTNLEPMDKAIESVQYLKDKGVFDIYILTAPSIKNPLCYTEKRVWIEKYLGMDMVKKLIISPNKGLNKGEYLIDDHISGSGQDSFEGTLIQFGSSQFPNWDTVLEYLDAKHT